MKKILLATTLALLTGVTFGQMKIGSNPSTINKSSILELESTRQGLLLPRVPGANLDAPPLLTAPDGMIVYVPDSLSLCVRRDGKWQKMSVENLAWNLYGNKGSDETKNFIGTTDAQGLVFKTNNTPLLKLTAGGNIEVQNNATTLPTGAATDVQVLLVNPTTGTIVQRQIATTAFSNAILSLNGITDNAAHKFAISNLTTAPTGFTSTSDGAGTATHTLNIPVQDGSSSTNTLGLLTYNDWVRFDANAKAQIVSTLFDAANPDANGLSIVANPDLTKPNTNIIKLHAATETTPGGVSAAAQTFGGTKNFKDPLSVGVASGSYATSTFEVNGSIASNITTMTTSGTLDDKSNTILANAGGGSISITLPATAGIKGRMYTIKKVGNGAADGGIDNTVTIVPTGATIDGGANYIIYNDWTFVTLQTDGTNWYIIKK